jgi:hypothetical protein
MKIPEHPLPEGIVKRDVKMYSLTGWYLDPTISKPPTAMAFGGYFRHDPEFGALVDGQLIDVYGPSSIEGTMNEKELEFDKTYDHRNYAIYYSFKKQNGIWVGKWRSPQIKGEHGTKAITNLIEDDAFHISCGKPRRF